MSTQRKYVFDTVFSPDGHVLRDTTRGVRAVFTAEEVEVERQAAYEAGRGDELARTQGQVAGELSRVGGLLAAMMSAYAQDLMRLRTAAADLALASARAVAGVALEAHGTERIRTVLEDVLGEAIAAPRILVRLSPTTAEAFRAEAEQIAAEHGFSGSFQVKADATLGAGDVVIDWGHALVALNTADAMAEVETRVRQRLAAGDEAEGH